MIGLPIIATLGLFWPLLTQYWDTIQTPFLSSSKGHLEETLVPSLKNKEDGQTQPKNQEKRDSNNQSQGGVKSSPSSRSLKTLKWWFENLPFPSEADLEKCLHAWNQVGDEYSPRLTSYTYQNQTLIKLEMGSTWRQVLREKGDQIWLSSPPIYRSTSSQFQHSTDPQTQLFRHLRVVGCLKQIGGLIHDPELLTTWTEQEWLGVLQASSLSPWMGLQFSQSEEDIEVTGLDRLGESNLQFDFSPPLHDLKEAVIWAFNPQEEHSPEKQQEFVLDSIEETTNKECTSPPLHLSFQKRVECRLLFLKSQSHLVHQNGSRKNSKRLKQSKKQQEEMWLEFPRLRSVLKEMSRSKRKRLKASLRSSLYSHLTPDEVSKKTSIKNKKSRQTKKRKKRKPRKKRNKRSKKKKSSHQKNPSNPQKKNQKTSPLQFEYK